ncbi:MAG TPA: Flp family type IVb pilin [Sphingomicrobium sp.]
MYDDRCAATAAEYALVLAIVGGSMALAAFSLGDRIGCSIDRSAGIVDGTDSSLGHGYGKSDPNGVAKGHRTNC